MNKLEANIHRGIIALAISFSFMFFVYAPLEVFLGNTNEFWFDITHLAPIIGVCFLISGAFIILFLELLYKFLYSKSKNAKRAFYIIYMIMLMIFVGLYIQGNYIPRDYGVLDGSTIEWSSYTTYAMASIVLWGVIVVIGIGLWVKLRKQMFKIGQGVSAIIFVMLFVALMSLFLTTDCIVKKEQYVVTDKGQWTLSENRNIYVLVLDSFDAEYLRVLLNENEVEYSKLLEDFTFYSNSTGGYPSTKASIPLLLTGEWYENDIPFSEYVHRSGVQLYNELEKNDYSIGVYTGENYIPQEADYYENVYNGEYAIASSINFIKTLYKLIAFEYVPHQLKQSFVVNTNDFDKEKTLADGQDIEGSVYTLSSEKYYKDMCDKGFSLDSENNCFRFVHLYGMHPPYIFGETVVEDGVDYTYLDASKGNMNKIKELIENLKEKDVYDNTAIMILADHGGGVLASELYSNPLLLIKGFDEHHEFAISEKPISWEDIYPTLISWVSGEEQENAVWNILDGERERRFLYYIWDDTNSEEYMPTMVEYTIAGNIGNKTAQIRKTGRRFVSAEVSSLEVKGLTLPDMSGVDFLIDSPYKIEIFPDVKSKDFQAMYVEGMGEIATRDNGKKYAWSKGIHTHFRLNPEGVQKIPYVVTINFDEIYSANNVDNIILDDIYVTVNGERVLDNKVTDSLITFTVSAEMLAEDFIDVLINYSPNNKEDDRTIAITSIILEQKFPVNIDENLLIDFSNNGNFEDMVTSGWWGQEESGVWSTEAASVAFLSDNDSDLILQLQYTPLISEVSTIVQLNGHEICTLSQENANYIIIPKEYLNPVYQVLEFVTEGAQKPVAIGMNEDTRILGIYVKSMAINDVK